MVPNPFIAFAQDPVGILAWVGYALLLVTIGFGAVRTVLRGIPTLYIQYKNNRHTDAWWAFGDRRNGYIPPLGWSIRLMAYGVVLAIAAWAAGALIWLVR